MRIPDGIMEYDDEFAQLSAPLKTSFMHMIEDLASMPDVNQLSDEDLRVLLCFSFSECMGDLIECGFETKMAEWSRQLFGRPRHN